MPRQQAFWDLPLDSLNNEEWEALCDHCGKCCLHKLEDEETGDIAYTAVACRLLDIGCVRCMHYFERAQKEPNCMILSLDNIKEMCRFLPKTCAYRLRAEGKPLPLWHPLRHAGSRMPMEMAGHSVRHRVVSARQHPEWAERLKRGEVDDDLIDAVVIHEWD